jgi:hypothetical protein
MAAAALDVSYCVQPCGKHAIDGIDDIEVSYHYSCTNDKDPSICVLRNLMRTRSADLCIRHNLKNHTSGSTSVHAKYDYLTQLTCN